MNNQNWECVIGLEIHAQLKTQSKIFCNDSTEFQALENENTSPVSLGFPGALPVLNKNVVEFAILTGLALNCQIQKQSVFSRKHYFYPDLPKGFQISQYDKPLCENGFVEFHLEDKKIKVSIERAHLEEDAGKSTHHGEHTLINFNRAGVALLEIVSAPDMRGAKEAAEYARAIKNILEYIEVCDGNLEEGSLRCDCNISVRRFGEKKLGTKVELKNLNSFRFIEKALEYEKNRQIEFIQSGKNIVQETRLYDSTKNKTFSMRTKEDAHDYRYFAEPDLLPLTVSSKWIEQIKNRLPELPLQKALRFQKTYEISPYDSQVLTQNKELSFFFEDTAKRSKNPKAAANWMMGDFLKHLNEEKTSVTNSPVSSKNLAEMIQMIDKKIISGKMAKTIFQKMWETGKPPENLVNELGLSQITDEKEIENLVLRVLENSKEQVSQYKSGKTKVYGFFIGQIMKLSKGQANPEVVNKILKKCLK